MSTAAPRIALLLLALLPIPTASAHAPVHRLTISGGHPEGNYDAIAGRLRTRLVVEHDYSVQVVNSQGSQDDGSGAHRSEDRPARSLLVRLTSVD